MVTTTVYNMESYLKGTVDRYKEVAQKLMDTPITLKEVGTPFLQEDQNDSPTKSPCAKGAHRSCPWCKHSFPVGDFKQDMFNIPFDFEKAKNRIQYYKEAKLKEQQLTPACAAIPTHNRAENKRDIQQQNTHEQHVEVTLQDGSAQGRLQPIAASILMGILYAARMARFDVLRATCRLACYTTCWTKACDVRLMRIMSYINTTLSHIQVGWVGEPISELQLQIYADADFAGCKRTQRSTSGIHLNVEGNDSRFPLIGICKRQGCVSNSTPEAEMLAGYLALRHVLIPAVDLWETLSPNGRRAVFNEDNQAMIRVCQTGKNQL